MKSVFQRDKECWVCGMNRDCHEHHIFGGPCRKASEKRGLKIYLCPGHHNMSDAGIHFNEDLDNQVKTMGQKYYESHYGSRDQFRSEFIRSYI